MTKTSLVYITAKDAEQAEAIGRTLVEERLASCANIVDGMNSLFWWDGEIQDESEAILIVKTREDLVTQLTERVKELHSYECPCVVVLPITGGNPDFLKWIADETQPADA
jgi:periplasmic divalent cation tolerance protein